MKPCTHIHTLNNSETSESRCDAVMSVKDVVMSVQQALYNPAYQTKLNLIQLCPTINSSSSNWLRELKSLLKNNTQSTLSKLRLAIAFQNNKTQWKNPSSCRALKTRLIVLTKIIRRNEL